MTTQKITGQTQLNPPIPDTTAANDFQVGDGSGHWIKNTLAQVATTLQTLLDSAYLKLTGGTLTGSLVVSPTPADTDASDRSLVVTPVLTGLLTDISRMIVGIYANATINSPSATSLLNTNLYGSIFTAVLSNNIPINSINGIGFSATSYASAVAVLNGIFAQAFNDNGVATDLSGAQVVSTILKSSSGTSSATRAYGIRVKVTAQTNPSGATATITNGYGFYNKIGAQSQSGGTPNIVNAYGVYLADFLPDDGYTKQLISNITQLFIERPTNGVSTNYSIVSNGINWFLSGAVSDVPVTIKGFAGQTANLTEWYNASGTLLSYVDSVGVFNPPSGTQIHIALTGQTTSLGPTNIITPPTDGLFRLSYYVETIVAGSVGTLALAFGWTDENGVQAITPVSSLSLTTTGYASGATIIHAKTTGTINYTVTLMGVVGSPQYNLYIFLERLF